MKRKPCVTALTHCLPAASGATDNRCKTPSVYKNNTLLSFCKTIFKRLDNRGRKTFVYRLMIDIYHRNPRHLATPVTR